MASVDRHAVLCHRCVHHRTTEAGPSLEDDGQMKLTWGKVMRMYKVYHKHPVYGDVLDWFPRKDEAEAFYADNREFASFQPSGVEVVDIPISRLGLRDWLNRYMTRDNG